MQVDGRLKSDSAVMVLHPERPSVEGMNREISSQLDNSEAIRPSKGLLVAVCSTPPITKGLRTLNRLAMAQDILGFNELAVANIFGLPTRSTGDIAHLGINAEPWLNSRFDLEQQIMRADGIVLAYGTSAPSGPARQHWNAQVEWLLSLVYDRQVPSWSVNGETRHPSRWQRHTHRQSPDLPFKEALALAFRSHSTSRVAPQPT